MTEQHPGYNSEQPATPEAERLAQLEAALAEAQEQRREAERVTAGFRLWQWTVNTAMSSAPTEQSVGANFCWRELRTSSGVAVTVFGSLQEEEWRWSIDRYDKNAPASQPSQTFFLSTRLNPGEVTVAVHSQPYMPLGPEVVEAIHSEMSSATPLGPTVYETREG